MSLASRKRLGILISGRGSNMQAFIQACEKRLLNADIAVVISNNPDAAGLELAKEAGIATQAVDHRQFESREAFDAALVECLQAHRVDLVILAGFMRILTPTFISPYAGRLLNIHPSLLPKYPGLNTHQRALDAGDGEAGVTVHFVTPELDGGPPILQARVSIEPDDTAETLASRVISKEHSIYPLAASWFVDERLSLKGGKACLDGEALGPRGLDYASYLH
ncbi:MAG: phosphoribosylglycinamide formyltransferase [Halioglobus sp.]